MIPAVRRTAAGTKSPCIFSSLHSLSFVEETRRTLNLNDSFRVAFNVRCQQQHSRHQTENIHLTGKHITAWMTPKGSFVYVFLLIKFTIRVGSCVEKVTLSHNWGGLLSFPVFTWSWTASCVSCHWRGQQKQDSTGSLIHNHWRDCWLENFLVNLVSVLFQRVGRTSSSTHWKLKMDFSLQNLSDYFHPIPGELVNCLRWRQGELFLSSFWTFKFLVECHMPCTFSKKSSGHSQFLFMPEFWPIFAIGQSECLVATRYHFHEDQYSF